MTAQTAPGPGTGRQRLSRLTRGLSPLRHRGFRLLTGGQLASNIGDNFYAVALPWYVLAAHGGPLLLGTVLAAYGIPRTALIAVGGHASDRWRPWTVMLGSDIVRTLAMTALAVATALEPARAVILVPIAVVLGAGGGMFVASSFAIIPELLPDEDLQAGNALISAGTQLATLAGPALGGLIVAFFGSSPAFALDAASFAISAITLTGVRAGRRAATTGPVLRVAPASAEPTRPGGPASTASAEPTRPGTVSASTVSASTESAGTGTAGTGTAGTGTAGPRPKSGQTVRGLLRSERVLQIMLLVTLAANLGSGGMGDVALPALAHGPMHTGAGGYGGLIATLGAGALVGTLIAGHIGRLRRPAMTGSGVFLIEAVTMAIVPYLGGAIGAGVALFVFGVMNGFGNVIMITAWQRWAPPQMLGRLNGVLMTASFGIFPVSVLLGAIVVRSLGAAPFFPMAGATLALAIFAGLTQREWRDYGMVTDSPSTMAAATGVR